MTSCVYYFGFHNGRRNIVLKCVNVPQNLPQHHTFWFDSDGILCVSSFESTFINIQDSEFNFLGPRMRIHLNDFRRFYDVSLETFNKFTDETIFAMYFQIIMFHSNPIL